MNTSKRNSLSFLERDMITAAETTPVKELVRLMSERRIGAIPILQGETLIGIVSERDIVRRLVYENISVDKVTAADIMTRDVTSVDIKDDPATIYNTLCSIPFRHLPILDKGKLVGIATEKDIREGLLNENHAFRKFIFDQKFRYNKLRYVGQCSLAALSIFIILLVFNAFSNAAIVAALGASSFIIFGMPHRNSSKPRFLIGGYIVGIVVGLLFSFLKTLPFITALPFVASFGYAIFGALGVGLSIFLMSITDTEHPPAAGIALGLVLQEPDFKIVALILAGIILLSLIKKWMKPHLKDLL